jgi:hypothetical protein
MASVLAISSKVGSPALLLRFLTEEVHHPVRSVTVRISQTGGFGSVLLTERRWGAIVDVTSVANEISEYISRTTAFEASITIFASDEV